MKMWQRVYLFVGSLLSLFGLIFGLSEMRFIDEFLVTWISWSLPLIIYGFAYLFFYKMK